MSRLIPHVLQLIEDLFLFLNNPIYEQPNIQIPYVEFIPHIIKNIISNFDDTKHTITILRNSPKTLYYLKNIKHKLDVLPPYIDVPHTLIAKFKTIIDSPLIYNSISIYEINFKIPDYIKLLHRTPTILPMPIFTDVPIKGVISTSFLGNLSYKYGNYQEVYTLRQKFIKSIGIAPHKIISFGLANGNNTITLDEFQNQYPNYKGMLYLDMAIEKNLFADALIFNTNVEEYGAFFLVGDCSLILLYDPYTRIWAFAHVGKPALTTDLLGNTIKKLTNLGVNPSNLRVVLGPTIYKYSYQYNNRVLELKNNLHWKDFILKMSEELYTPDLIGAIRNRLVELGVKYDNILITPIDTFSSPLLFSHQRSYRLKVPEQRFGVLVAPKQLFTNT